MPEVPFKIMLLDYRLPSALLSARSQQTPDKVISLFYVLFWWFLCIFCFLIASFSFRPRAKILVSPPIILVGFIILNT